MALFFSSKQKLLEVPACQKITGLHPLGATCLLSLMMELQQGFGHRLVCSLGGQIEHLGKGLMSRRPEAMKNRLRQQKLTTCTASYSWHCFSPRSRSFSKCQHQRITGLHPRGETCLLSLMMKLQQEFGHRLVCSLGGQIEHPGKTEATR